MAIDKMSFILGHLPFGVSVIALLVCLGFFIYLSISMFKKSKTLSQEKDRKTSKKMGQMFIAMSVLIVIILLVMILRHYNISVVRIGESS